MSLKLNPRDRPKCVVGEEVDRCYKLVMVSPSASHLTCSLSIFRLETLVWGSPAC